MNKQLPSQSPITGTLLFFLFCFANVQAQTFQKSYPTTSGYSIETLGQPNNGDITSNLKNGLANAFFIANASDGSFVSLTPAVPDCDLAAYGGGDLRLSATEFIDKTLTAANDLKLRWVQLSPNNCTVNQVFFEQEYDLSAAVNISITNMLFNSTDLSVFVGGVLQLTPISGSTQYRYFIKKINAASGVEMWEFQSPVLTVAGFVPGLKLLLATNGGGIVASRGSLSSTDLFLLKLDGNGQLVFDQLFAGPLTQLKGISEAGNADLLIRTFTASVSGPGDAPGFRRLSGTGNLIYQVSPSAILSNELGNFQYLLSLPVHVAFPNGEVLLVGKNTGTVGIPGAYLIKLDASGQALWTRFYPGLNVDFTHAILTPDNGFLLGGTLNNEVFLMKTDANGLSEPPCPNTLLTNANFENGLQGWSTTGEASVTTNSFLGNKAAQVCGTSAGSISQIITTTPGKQYKATVWAKVQGQVDQSVPPFVQLRFLNASYAPINDPAIAQSRRSVTSSAYIKRELYATAPVGAAYAHVLFWKEKDGCLIVDEVELCEGVQAPPTYAHIFCPLDKVVQAAPGANGAVVSVFGPGSSTLASCLPDNLVQTAGLPPGSFFPVGTNQVCFTFSNSCGDSETCCFNIIVEGATSACNIAPSVNAILCNDNGTATNPADDRFSFTLNATNPAQSTGYQVFIPQTSQAFQGTYGSPLTIQNVPIAAGNLTLNLTDNVTGGCSASVSVSAPAPCSNTSVQQPDLSFSAAQVTPTAVQAGSTFNLQFTVQNLGNANANGFAITHYLSTDANFSQNDVAIGGLSSYLLMAGSSNPVTQQFSLSVNTAPGNYFLILVADPTNLFQESNENNNAFSVPMTVIGSGGSDQIDLSLVAQQLTANPAQWSNYPVKLTLSNAGPQAATGVKVKFAKPTGVVYVGGNTHTASQGTFNAFSDEVWTVGSIPANGSATLTVNYFLLNATAPVAYAQVTAHTETDSDSQPNNGTPPTPVQDDEASTAGGNTGGFTCPGNLLVNGDMETNTGWVGTNFSYVNSDVYQGNSSISIIMAPQVLVGAALQNFVPVAGNQYTLSFFAKTKASGQPVTLPPPSVRIDIFGGTGASIASDFINNLPLGGSYQAYTLQVTSPAGATSAQVRLEGGGGIFLLVDNVCLTASTPAQPDLTIADLQIPTASVAAGAVLNYNFDASNAGTTAVPGNFTIKSFISTDQTLSANDVQDGTINTGNYPAGFAAQNVAGASTIPTNLAAGQYYLIVKIDADNAVAEGNENNNVVVKPFTVTGGGSSCNLSVSVFGVTCSDNGTPSNPNDDTFSFDTRVTNGLVSGSWRMFVNGEEVIGNYGTNYGIGIDIPISGGSLNVTLSDLANSACSTVFTVPAPPPCSIGGTPTCSTITITPAPNKLTIAGFSAPHVLIKVFRPNWTVAYECLDGACATPTVITGLGMGSHFVEVKLMNAGWGEICKKTQTVGVTNIVAEQDERLRLSFDRIYPNPTAYLTTMELYSPVEQAATLDFYDRTGRLVHTLDVQLEQGQNLIEQLVFDWKSGTYNVVARGEKTGLPAYGRFLKVWEE